MVQQVMAAVKQAFETENVVDHLSVADSGRVFGRVTVKESPTFDRLDDARRQQLFWTKLQEILGAKSLEVGPVVLEPTNRG